MMTNKLHAGDRFPDVTALNDKGDSIKLSEITNEALDWKLVLVYRGRHCPLCTRYLNELETWREKLESLGVEIIAVSGDSAVQVREHRSRLDVSFPLAHGMTTDAMRALGLYISHPRSPQETDHPFAEPGLFVVNADGNLHVVDISNNPFVRPDLETLVSGIEWIRNPENNYPVRGTWAG